MGTRLSITSPSQIYTFNATTDSVTVGRSLKCDFNIPKEDLSREHCRIDIVGEDYFITDLGSKNGVFVDRIRLLPNERAKITETSLVVLASIYQMKINAYEIKTRSDIVIKIPKVETETVTFEMDFLMEQKAPATKKRPPVEDVPRSEAPKMVAGFIAVIAIMIIYQALGR